MRAVGGEALEELLIMAVMAPAGWILSSLVMRATALRAMVV
jgi:hypothetical protein